MQEPITLPADKASQISAQYLRHQKTGRANLFRHLAQTPALTKSDITELGVKNTPATISSLNKDLEYSGYQIRCFVNPNCKQNLFRWALFESSCTAA